VQRYVVGSRGSEEATAAYIASERLPTLPEILTAASLDGSDHAWMHLQRAEEIQAVEPRVSYYCRLYAIKKVS